MNRVHICVYKLQFTMRVDITYVLLSEIIFAFYGRCMASLILLFFFLDLCLKRALKQHQIINLLDNTYVVMSRFKVFFSQTDEISSKCHLYSNSYQNRYFSVHSEVCTLI